MAVSEAPKTEVQIFLDRREIAGLLHASIVTSNCFSSDSYSLVFAMGSFPLVDINFWSAVTTAYIEIYVASENGLASQALISGTVDTVIVDPIRNTAAIEGRDLSSLLIDSYRQQDFVNQTASDVVSAIASYHGLEPIVTATLGSVGRYFGDGFTRLSLGQFSRIRSDWDLVVQLARENNFDVFVSGESFYFQSSSRAEEMPVQIGRHQLKTMRFERALSIASNAAARVQSWNSQQMKSYDSGSVNPTPDAAQVATSTTSQPFLFSASNFTSQQVTDSVGRYTAELGHLNLILHIEMPWDLSLSPRTIILINSTDSQFDQEYRVDSIERHYSTTFGSKQIIRAVTANSDFVSSN